MEFLEWSRLSQMFRVSPWEKDFFLLPQTLFSVFPLPLPDMCIMICAINMKTQGKSHHFNQRYALREQKKLTASAASFAALKRLVRCWFILALGATPSRKRKNTHLNWSTCPCQKQLYSETKVSIQSVQFRSHQLPCTKAFLGGPKRRDGLCNQK